MPVTVPQPSKQKRKFSSFFKSLVIELDKELYGPDNHLVEVRVALGHGEHGWTCWGTLVSWRAKRGCSCLLP